MKREVIDFIEDIVEAINDIEGFNLKSKRGH